MTKLIKKSLGDFQRVHDPLFEVGFDHTVYSRPIDWKKTKRAIVVAAQNATPVDQEFWAVLEFMCKNLGAELLVIPYRYKNPTSHWSGSQKNAERWAPEVTPYLWSTRVNVNNNLQIIADFKIQAATSNPLGQMDAVSLSMSGIVGHPRAQSKSVATPQSKMAKFLSTTGACTVPNYTDTRLGKLGEFHHRLTALLIEFDGGKFYMRRLQYSAGTKRVIDNGVAYYKNRKDTAPPSLALVMGDTHVDVVDPTATQAIFGSGGIVERTRPQRLVWHDLLDGQCINPHDEDDPFVDIALWLAGRQNAKGEVDRAISHLLEHHKRAKQLTKAAIESIVVVSNHNDRLRRWVVNSDWKKLSPENRSFYLRTALIMADRAELLPNGPAYPDPFIDMIREANIGGVTALNPGEPYSVADIILSMHGNVGPNGSRGSINNLKRIGTKSVIAHTHSTGEDEGCTQVGTTSRLDLVYAMRGPSSWLQSVCDINADAKRQLVIIVDGKFCMG